MTDTAVGQTPKHIWIVGVLSLLWNSFGGYDYVMTQTRNADYLAMFTPEQRAYFENFPAVMEFFWALGVWGAVAGSILLLLRSRHAVTAFAVSLLGLAVSTVWQFGFSGADLAKIMGGGAMIMNVVIWVGALFFLWYAYKQRSAGTLR
jgi:hypothetical protein